MGDERALVLLHGLWLGGWALRRLEKGFGAPGGEAVHRYAWPTVRADLSENARRLRQFAISLEASRIDWIGHSLGGVLILKMLTGWQDRPPGRIVCLGSPLTGSHSASRLAGARLGRRLAGRSILEGVIGASAADWCDPSVAADTGVVAGRRGTGAGRLLGRLEPPHDGTVRVAETRLPGLADHLVLNVSHTGLLFSGAAARAAAAFLATGRFPREPT